MKQIKAGEHPKVIALRQISRTETARDQNYFGLKIDCRNVKKAILVKISVEKNLLHKIGIKSYTPLFLHD